MSRIRVLVVDDSAFARKVLREVLARDPEIEVVGFARDGIEALEKIGELAPDVLTLDLVMPELDGIGVLRSLPTHNPPKVVVVTVSGSETELALEALAAGAVDLVNKPTALATDRLYELSEEVCRKVKAAAAARPYRAHATSSGAKQSVFDSANFPRHVEGGILAIGTSTGGPQALTHLFADLPANLPVPIAIALHIPAGYTGPLAERISRGSAVPIVEAEQGMKLIPGRAVIAPGGQHLRITRKGDEFFAEVSAEPRDSLYHPSVDILFTSVAEAAGSNATVVVLTGMGSDGTQGAKLVKAAGGAVLAESASSCVVYGMPRSVIESGLATAEAPLDQVSRLIVQTLGREQKH